MERPTLKDWKARLMHVLEEKAPTSTGEPAGKLQPMPAPKHAQHAGLKSASGAPAYMRKPALPALTGIRSLLALTIMLFHFTPSGLTWAAHPRFTLYPIINIGYVFVSFFFVISGFILYYNYAERPGGVNAIDFWVARASRLYPIYLLTMLVSIPMLAAEWHARSHTQFVAGVITTPLLIQGFFPRLATFWNTVSWTLSCEVALYLLFPWLVKLKLPKGVPKLVAMGAVLWLLGMAPHAWYLATNPDHLAHAPDRYSGGVYIDFLKYTPLPYLCTFLCGITIGRIHQQARLGVRGRMMVGLAGFAIAWFCCYHLADDMPYILVHGGLLTPVFGMIILGLAGPSPLATIFSWRPLVAIGTSTYCLYLLHFNAYQLIHDYHLPERLHVQWIDPWISYAVIVLVAMAARKWVEHPFQIAIGNWWKRRREAQREDRERLALAA
ncbi:MAG TPA: acyltransferase [Acidobacteriaceae bacterium]|nr:acyltransferase [Acidobacteriaceae bacterium]